MLVKVFILLVGVGMVMPSTIRDGYATKLASQKKLTLQGGPPPPYATKLAPQEKLTLQGGPPPPPEKKIQRPPGFLRNIPIGKRCIGETEILGECESSSTCRNNFCVDKSVAANCGSCPNGQIVCRPMQAKHRDVCGCYNCYLPKGSQCGGRGAEACEPTTRCMNGACLAKGVVAAAKCRGCHRARTICPYPEVKRKDECNCDKCYLPKGSQCGGRGAEACEPTTRCMNGACLDKGVVAAAKCRGCHRARTICPYPEVKRKDECNCDKCYLID